MTKRSKEKFTARPSPGGVSKAHIKVYLETQETEREIFQNFRLVVSEIRLLRYFTDDMFLGSRYLESEMAKLYAGDGEKIVFRKKVLYNNLITVVFDKLDKDAKVKEELQNVQFEVEAPIPSTQGCTECEHFRRSSKACAYYGIFLDKLRTNCPDFRQKEVHHGKAKEEDDKDGKLQNPLT